MDKGHTEGLEPNITEEIAALTPSASGRRLHWMESRSGPRLII